MLETQSNAKGKRISPSPYNKNSVNTNINDNNDTVKLKSTPKQPKKHKVYLEIIIDGTYSMSVIYSFLYNRLIGEVNELKKINADIFIKTVVAYDKNDIRNMGDFGSTAKFKKDLLSIEFHGGSYDGFEPCLNDAIGTAVYDLENIGNADLKGLMLVTDSMPGMNGKLDIDVEDMCDFEILFVNEPKNHEQFIDLKRASMRNIRDFLGNSEKKVLYAEIDGKIKSMENDI